MFCRTLTTEVIHPTLSVGCHVKGLLEIKDTHRPKVLRYMLGYTSGHRTSLGMVRVLNE